MRLLAPFAVALMLAAPAVAARNIVVFVADGLRYGSVTPEDAPNMHRLKTSGVDFANSHSMYPTLTTVNASAIATGHYIGDTGNFGNYIYIGARPLPLDNWTSVPDLEDNAALAAMNRRFGGNYLGETSFLAAARAHGYQTAAIGKVGPSRIQDTTAAADGNETLIIDDETGRTDVLARPAWFTDAMKSAFVDNETPPKSAPNIAQEVQLMRATTRIVLPHFAKTKRPFALVFWSRDPDTTQHDARDSIGEYSPGINGPSGRAAVHNADTMLGELLAALKTQGLDGNTDVFVTADHGFYTITRASETSPSAKAGAAPGEARQLDPAFLAKDLGDALTLKVTQITSKTSGNAALGDDATDPQVVVASNGGSDLIYLPGDNAKALVPNIVAVLARHDYVSGIFVNDRFGPVPGTLPMSAVGLIGTARTPQPDIVVSFRTFALDCADKLMCTVGVVEGSRVAGQGSHGALTRAATRNFMAAIGPDFKAGYVDQAPVGNADIAPTLAKIAGFALRSVGKLKGRVIGEALTGGAEVTATRKTLISEPGPGGVRTILNEQAVGDTRYFDAAGFSGRTVGLTSRP